MNAIKRVAERPGIRRTARGVAMFIAVIAAINLSSNTAGAATGCHGMALDGNLSVAATTEYSWNCGDSNAPYTTGIYLNDDGTLSAQSFSAVPGSWSLHLYDATNQRLMQTPIAGPVFVEDGQVVQLRSYAQAPSNSFAAAIVFAPSAEYASYYSERMLVELRTFYR